MEWINKILHIAGNYVQYSVISHSERQYKKVCVYIYICITNSLDFTAEINIVIQLYLKCFLKRPVLMNEKNVVK